jgi:hypothetical protein
LKNNIKMDLREIVLDSIDWANLAQVAGSCECGNEPSGSIKYWEILEQLGD